MHPSYARELEVAIAAAQQASEIVIAHYRSDFAVKYKGPGKSDPVTAADQEANTLIIGQLAEAFPEDAILAEESEDNASRLTAHRMWCVDPVDGTQDFVDRTDDFCVMIGLAVGGEAVLGVVLAPTTGDLFTGVVGHGAFLTRGGVRTQLHIAPLVDLKDRVIMMSRKHFSKRVLHVAQLLNITHKIQRGSVGLKMAVIAEGQAHGYISFSTRMHEWDTCGPEAIVRAAGGNVTDILGNSLRYNKPIPITQTGFVATGGTDHAMWLDAAVKAI